MKSKKVLGNPDKPSSEVEKEELIYSKEEIAPFTAQQEGEISHDGVVGRDWNVSSKDDG